jgi:hypothetical protein
MTMKNVVFRDAMQGMGTAVRGFRRGREQGTEVVKEGNGVCIMEQIWIEGYRGQGQP